MTRSRTRGTLAGCMALAVLGAVAVLDVRSATADAAPSPFAGSWSGTWAIPALEKGGTFDWTISDAGRITGRVVTTTFGTSGTIVGHVGDGGNIMMIGYVPNDVPFTGQNGAPFQGTAQGLVLQHIGTGLLRQPPGGLEVTRHHAPLVGQAAMDAGRGGRARCRQSPLQPRQKRRPPLIAFPYTRTHRRTSCSNILCG